MQCYVHLVIEGSNVKHYTQPQLKTARDREVDNVGCTLVYGYSCTWKCYIAYMDMQATTI